jgi:hypothetical protein
VWGLPRIRRLAEARLTRYTFGDYPLRLPAEEQQSFSIAVRANEGVADPNARTEASRRPGRAYGMSELRRSRIAPEEYSTPELSLGRVVTHHAGNMNGAGQEDVSRADDELKS